MLCTTCTQTPEIMRVHHMKLRQAPFEMIKSGRKTIELRLYDEKRKNVKVGDEIVFSRTDSPEETLRVKVIGLFLFPTFDALYDALPLTECGYTPENVSTARASDMDSYYPREEQLKYGVLGIKLSVI